MVQTASDRFKADARYVRRHDSERSDAEEVCTERDELRIKELVRMGRSTDQKRQSEQGRGRREESRREARCMGGRESKEIQSRIELSQLNKKGIEDERREHQHRKRRNSGSR